MLKKAQGQLARRGALVVLAAVGALCSGGASSAMAATISGTGDDPVFTADPGFSNALTVTQTADKVVFDDTVEPIDVDPAIAADCQANTPATGDVTCTAPSGTVNSVTAHMGDGADLTDFTDVRARTIQNGGDDDDILTGGQGNDTLDGGAGADILFPNAGVDDVHGGSGVDFVSFSDTAGITVTLDDAPDDGVGGEGDNIHSDVEDVQAGSGTNTIVGSAAFNFLVGGAGSDDITGGPGNDFLSGSSGDDTIHADDGFADRVNCGSGDDIAIVDTLDIVADNCEPANIRTVNVGDATNTPSKDAPPSVEFVSPAEGATLPIGSTAVTINASDDKGISKVTLLDGGKVVGTDTTAPYTIAYSPTAADVGSHTLVATATDTADQSASALRKVTVTNSSTGGSATTPVAPKSVSATVLPKRDRTRPYTFTVKGAVGLPAGVTKAQGCASGTVKVTGKLGLKNAFTKTAKLKKDCTYSVTATVTRKGRVKITARFSGNSALKAKSSLTRTIRAG